MEKRNIKALHQLAEEGYDLIINCSGLGARELVADKTMTPIRGQVYKVIDSLIYIAYHPLFRFMLSIYSEVTIVIAIHLYNQCMQL